MRTAFWTTALLAAFVHWIPHFPPQIDLAQHAGQMRFLHDWTQPDFLYRDILELNLFTPYLPAYLLGALLTFVMSPVTAVKLLWSVGAFGTVYASVRIRRRIGGSAEWDWLLLPGLFGVTFVWGLLTFQFAVPFALLAVEYWMVYLDRPGVRRGVVFGLALIGLFFSHALVTAWVLLVCGVMVLATPNFSPRDLPRAIVRGLPLLAPLPVISFWLSVTGEREQAQGATVWGYLPERVFSFFSELLGGPFPALAAGVGAAIFLSPFLAGKRFSPSAVHRAPLLITVAILLAGPFRMFGNAFTYNRFFSILGPTLLIAIAAGPMAASGFSRLRHLVPLLSLAWVLFIASRMVLFSTEQRAFSRVLAEMESDLHVLSVVEYAGSRALGNEGAYLHFPVWYQAERGGLVEFSFAAFYPMLLRFSASQTSYVPEIFAARPTHLSIAREVKKFDQILARVPLSDSTALTGLSVVLVKRAGQWRLYEARDRAAVP